MFRRMWLKDLKPVPVLAPGTRVTVDTSTLVVGRYVPEGDTYLLYSPDPDKTVAASAALVRELPTVTTCAGAH